MMLKFKYNEKQSADYLKFGADESLEFKIEDAWESSGGEAMTLLCRVLSDDQAERLTRVTMRFAINGGGANTGTLRFLRLNFTGEELKQGMNLKKLLDKRFSCVSKLKTVNGREFQNFEHWKLIEGGCD